MRRVLGLLLVLLVLLVLQPALARTPLPVKEAPELYQRVLTLPNARLSPKPGAAAGVAVLPTFSILYVYGRTRTADVEWLEVGASARGETTGWLPVAMTEDWQSMLVMQYAPRGQRHRVAFFQDRDKLEQLLDADDSSARGKQIESGLENNQPDPALIAVEPTGAVDPKTQFYVMPVLYGKLKELADGTDVRLIEVASASAAAKPEPLSVPPPPVPIKPPRVGLVFLLDTTQSMQPYLDQVKQAVRRAYDALVQDGTAANVSFGLVGYRSNIQREPRLEYVTKVFAPLDPSVPADETLRRLDDIMETRFSTPAWDEDAFAGLHTALNALDWTPFSARFLVLVTDSGALPGKNPLVQFRNYDIDNVVEQANALHVAVFPVHLLTPAGDTHGDRARAVAQWQRLGQTGDAAVNKYTPIRAGSVSAFGQQLSAFADTFAQTVGPFAHDQPISRPDLGETKKTTGTTNMTTALVNEMFRAQAELLGARQNAAAPGFFRGWTSDHDLGNPRIRALNVQVFLTRNQLNGLAQSLKLIVDTAKQSALSPQDFFDNLQLLSARTAADPERPAGTGEVRTIRASNLLPSFLKLLPYKTKILYMTRDDWLSGGVSGQQEFIDDLDYKLQQYQDIYNEPRRWTALDPKDPGNAICPVPLDVLP